MKAWINKEENYALYIMPENEEESNDVEEFTKLNTDLEDFSVKPMCLFPLAYCEINIKKYL